MAWCAAANEKENEIDQGYDVMLRKAQVFLTSFHDPRRSLLENTVAILFGLAAANLCVVFLVQGGYEFSIGSILVHAHYLRKSLLLCLALAFAKVWLDGKRTGRALSESLRSPLLLFLLTILIYSLNDRVLWSGDTIPARYLPLSLIRELDFDLDEFPFLYKSTLPYFLASSHRHVVSAYPPWAAVLALPVYLGPALLGIDPTSLQLMMDLEKRAAMLITAVSVIVLFFALQRVTLQKTAWFIAIIYAFGTSSFSTSSQALWQHGPVQLFLALTIFYIVKGLEIPRFSAYSGFALSCMVISRPINLIVALPLVVYIVHKHRDQLVGFLLASVPPLLLFTAYNTFYFGAPFTAGIGTAVVTPSSVISTQFALFNTPLLAGVSGVLISPGRGLLVYSSVFVFSVVGMIVAWREPKYLYLRYLSCVPLLLLIMVSKWRGWWGGECYGPRLLADVTPILCFLLYPAVDYFEGKTAVKYVMIALTVLSIGMHAIGAGRDGIIGEKTWTQYYEIGRHPERLWSWRDSPPIYYGKQLLVRIIPEGSWRTRADANRDEHSEP
ncbi:MAG: hypothetical protein H7Y39_16805 [Nitrospiraceae bacterium]|nr:hypothetical protein [Nitrospiraceae bacterium]